MHCWVRLAEDCKIIAYGSYAENPHQLFINVGHTLHLCVRTNRIQSQCSISTTSTAWK